MVVELLDIAKNIGNLIPTVTEKILGFIEGSGVVASNLAERLISIMLILGIAWIILHFASGIKKPLAWVIKILALILILVIIVSTFTSIG